MTEQSTVDLINNLYGTKLTLCKGGFSDFDAEDSDYIVEVKNRRSYYKEKLIEAVKLFKNYQNSQLKGKRFLYVVTDDKGVYIYNISKDIDLIINLPTRGISCPVTTDFNKNHKITKICYVLPEGLAIKI